MKRFGLLWLLTLALAVPKLSLAEETLPSFSISIVPKECQSFLGCDLCDIATVFTNGANIIAGILSGISLLMFIVGGFFWIFSMGNEQRIETGKKILVGTVTGLAIVFLAWFGVNLIVRLAASSAVSKPDGLPSENTVFGSAWWEPPKCAVTATTCSGQLIGYSCTSSGDCGKEGNCQCYRPKKNDGDNGLCEDNASAITSASADDKSCYCATACSIAGSEAEDSYSCVSNTTYDQSETTKPEFYDKKDFSCHLVGYTCVDSSH